MVKTIWDGYVIAESDQTEMVEGDHYFPAEHVRHEFLTPSDRRSTCPWKGMAQYYDLVVDGQTNSGAAWYYANPRPAARTIAGRIAFWKDVKVG